MIKPTEARANVALWDKQKVANQLEEVYLRIKAASCLGKNKIEYESHNHPHLYPETIDTLTKMGYTYNSGILFGIVLNKECISW